MKINVRFFAGLREITEKKQEEIKLSKVFSVGELLSFLSKKYGSDFTDYIYNDTRKIRSDLHFLKNGENIQNLQCFETKLEDCDEFAIIPPVGGG